MGKKKAVFFDIDGTIWNDKNEIPESTVRAIKMLRGNGNLAFLCSGRSRAYIRNPKLFEIGFDGVVSGCGTMVEYGGKTVFYKRLENELVERTILTVRRYGCRPILEGREYLYMDNDEFEDDYLDRSFGPSWESICSLLQESGESGRFQSYPVLLKMRIEWLVLRT